MAENRGICGCLACIGLLLLLAAFLVLLLLFGGFLVVLNDSPACHAIANKQPYILRMGNVTVKQGGQAGIDCKIVNYGLADKVYWTSSKFEAEMDPESPRYYIARKPQYGVDVAGGGWTSEKFYCLAEPKINGTIDAPLSFHFAFYLSQLRP